MKKTLKGFGILLGIILLLFVFLLFSGDDKTPNEVSTLPDEQQDIEKVYDVGDVVNINGLELTITSAAFTEPTEYSKPENGKVLTLTVEAVNKRDKKLMVDNTEFNLYDTEGNSLKSYYGYNSLPISGSINAEKKLSGELYFDATSDEQFELIYTSTWSSDGSEVTFVIKPTPIQN